MKIHSRKQTSTALALLLMLATVAAPWTSVLAMPCDHEGGMQQQHMHHTDMSMDSMDASGCCNPGEFSDCEQHCGTCTVTSVLAANPAPVPNIALSPHYNTAVQQFLSNIPPPPNKPPV